LGPKAPKRVLLVDDNKELRRQLRRLFESDGFACYESEDGAQAVEHAEQVRPDIIVLDFSMPVMSGLQAASLLRTKLPGTPIIMFTLFVSQGLVETSISAGAAAVIGKDQATTQLLLKANSLLNPYP
jgi:two-component system, OmpR family, response regulator MprA